MNSPVPVLGVLDSFELSDQFGRPVRSDDLTGMVWVATATSTRSGTNAPRQLEVMQVLHSQVAQEGAWHSIRLLNISPEPDHDLPEQLLPYAANAGADSVHWRFLTGPRDNVADLLEGLGLHLRENARTSHGPLTLNPRFVLVDRHLQVRGIYDVRQADEMQRLYQDLALVLPEAPDLSDGSGRTHLVVPAENLNLEWLHERGLAQREAASKYDIFHQFSFTNRLSESGITFRNKIVDTAGRSWMPNHYDHGNGIAVADVDGDGLIDVYFVTAVGKNELWRNIGRGRFENITEEAGVGLDDRITVTASFADIDNDGDPDLYVTSVKGGNALFLNDGSGRFRDVSRESGTDYVGHSSGAVFFDYDRDGLIDLFVTNVGVYTTDELAPVMNGTSEEQTGGRYQYYAGREDAFAAHTIDGRSERSILFRNLGQARFEDVTADVGLIDESWSGDATPMDGNGDGWPDLYILNMQGDDQYYENVEGKQFVRRTPEHFPRTPWGSMGVKHFDVNNDGQLDLFVTDMHSDMSETVGPDQEKLKSNMQWPEELLQGGDDNIFGNAFFLRTSTGAFEEVSDKIGAENYWPWGVSAGDLNADGFMDVFITASMNYPHRYGVNSVLLNERGERFLESEFVLGIEPRAEGRRLVPFFELDCDGVDAEHEHCLDRTGEIVVWAAAGSRSSAVFDLDNDGDLDIITNDFNSEPLVLVSDLSEQLDGLSYLKVRLVGTQSNRDGLGARVNVKARGATYTQVADGSTGYLSHGVLPLYFGLDRADVVDGIEIEWPSGATQHIDGPIRPNQLIEVREE